MSESAARHPRGDGFRRWVIGVGEPAAGDDAAGVLVVERLSGLGVPAGVLLVATRDPSEVTGMLRGAGCALVIDAVLDPARAGSVRITDSARFSREGARPLSSHGLDVLAAVELARTLSAGTLFPDVSFLTIAIERPRELGARPSAATLAAVEVAARLALDFLERADLPGVGGR